MKIIVTLVLVIVLASCTTMLEKDFQNPPVQYKPMPFWHINGELTTKGIRQQMKDAKEAGFSGVSLLPLAEKSPTKPGTTPKFLSEEYFDRYQDLLDVAEELGMEIILYDDNDFPSGMAGGKMEELYPEHTMKRLDKIEYLVKGHEIIVDTISCIKIMAAVAMNTETQQRVEISKHVKDNILVWVVPEGEWKIQLFPLVKDSFHKKYLCMDFMDTTAVRHMINETYEKYAERFESYFGNTIKVTFFDDVGFWRHPRNWTAGFNKKFKEINGFDPRPFYPALWENIGPETEAIRNAFFKTRAELLAEGFPKLVAQWNEKHGLKSTGHPPGNYDPTPIDMNADIFKYYRYTQIPLTDAIISYQFGQNGHKLISSAADYYDRPVVSTEIYGAYKEATFDSLMMYRSVMDLFARGANMVIPHGMWYNPEQVYISPLVSPYSDKIAPALPAYSNFVGRSCMLLQGGKRVSEIGVMYPFEELAGHFVFDNPDGIRQGFYVSKETDYQLISGILSNDIRRDFTFVHPEFLLNEKYLVEDGKIILNNAENYQEYKVMFLTGCKTISYKTLEKLKAFYESGGTIISTTQLPFKSSEMGHDQLVIDLVGDIFEVNPLQVDTTQIISSRNQNGGLAVHIPIPGKENIQKVLGERMTADVSFSPNPDLKTDFGKFNYIHKIKDGKHIYFFTNSSDKEIDIDVVVRGKHKLRNWNPHTGEITRLESSFKSDSHLNYTRCNLKLGAVSSVFFVEE
ncbi:glycosyl hydrolase [Draconibacterium sediminis]|uniref:Glycoside hydrolase family 42 N-terminal domain-containing protein n=1 Tax=Draconibacterium sediminis TaxID=1544798 RepID=A0A0D8J465_9BACT|nr:glycosyl hydrolase [Draconibacterium sediminis]KJF41735.1 hypothetical protein LH29_23685 [Draconibacterium sediminis]